MATLEMPRTGVIDAPSAPHTGPVRQVERSRQSQTAGAAHDVLTRYFPGAVRDDGSAHDGRAHYGEPLSGAALCVEFMKFVGVEVMFGIPGGASLPLNDALTQGHMEGAFRYVLTGHEQGAAFEAEGYAAASGQCGWCTATSGPGATNLLTGLADAYRDSRPVFALTGNTPTSAEPEAFQAIDIVGITHGKATKASFRPTSPEDVQAMLVKAYHTAVTGRPGSVLFDLAKDVQIKTAIMRPWEEIIAELDWSVPQASEEELLVAAHLLARAERPVLYAGHGVILAGAAAELRALSRRLNVPVATTVHGIGLLPDGDSLNLGMLGMHGQMVANIAPHLADVVIALGARFDDRVVGAKPEQFAPHAKVIHVDVDASQLNRVRQVDLAVHSDVKYALERLMDLSSEIGQVDREAWLSRLQSIKAAMPVHSYDTAGDDRLSHEFVYAAAAAALAEQGARDIVATFDVGTHQMKGAQWFPISQPRSFLTSGGMGSMGCSLPMAVGAAMARPDAAVIAVAGDGGFVMSSHELDTIGSYRIPVKMIVFDDSALGMVTNWHGLFFDGRDLTSDRRRGRTVRGVDLAGFKAALHRQIEEAETADQLVSAVCGATVELAEAEWPLFAATAASYAIPAERVRTKAEAAAAIRRALAHDGPYFIHVMLPSKNQVYPLMEPGTTPKDMVWRELIPGSGIKVYARDRFNYESGRLIAESHANGTDAHANGTANGHTPERDPNGF